MLVLAALLLASIPEGWLPPEITPGHAPARIVVTKSGWRSGSAALIVDDQRQADRLYRLLVLNSRMAFACGYHWNVRFEYRNHAPESIDINEKCEVFQRDRDAVQRELSRLFAQARHRPSHYVVALRQPVPMSTAPLRAKTEAFGTIVEGDPLLLASRRRWTKPRLDKLRRATAGLAKVVVIPEVDLGN